MINLKEVIKKYPECAENADKLRAYLYDLYPGRDNKRQIEIIISVAESGFQNEMSGKASIRHAHYKKYIDNLVATTDLNYEEAENGINCWLNALSVKKDAIGADDIVISPTHIHNYHKTVVQPTCKQKGFTKNWCDCGYEYNDSFKPIVKCKYDVYDRKEATCAKIGYIKSKCKWCGNETESVIQTKPHDYDMWKVVNDSTCIKEGLKKRVCRKCGKEESENIGMKSHEWSEWNEQIHPSCEKNGKSVRVCSVCGKAEEKELSKTGHSFTEWAESATEKGKWERICNNCGEVETLDYDPIKRAKDEKAALIAEKEKIDKNKEQMLDIVWIILGILAIVMWIVIIVLCFKEDMKILGWFSIIFGVGTISKIITG